MMMNRRVISDACFRVLSLQFETQNEVDVLKPMLEELEVLRLSCALGALSNVNLKDFEFEQLEPKDFDDELARFLQSNGYGCEKEGGPHVRVVGVFGKQAQVKNELQRLGGWNAVMEEKIPPRDQGLYAVVMPSSSDDDIKTVAVFVWLIDEHFHPDRMRATPTYLLRLLTCLTADVTFCLSQQDRQVLEDFAQSTENSHDEQEWKSYSIAFHVQQQRDADDNVTVSVVGRIPLPLTSYPRRRIELIKGSYPALMAVTAASRQKVQRHEKKQFSTPKQLCFWIGERMKEYDLRMSPIGWNPAVEEAMIRWFGDWPIEKLQECDEKCSAKITGLEEDSIAEATQVYDEYRCKLLSVRDVVFRIEGMWNPIDISEGVSVIKECIEDMKKENFFQNPRESTTILTLPLRLQDVLERCYELYQNNHHTELEAALKDAPTKRVDALFANARRERMITKVTTWLYGWFDSHEVPKDFRDRVQVPLKSMCEIWWSEVTSVLERYQDALARHVTKQRKAEAEKMCQEARIKVIHQAFSNIVDLLGRSIVHDLQLSIRSENFYGQEIVCRVSKDVWSQPHDQVLVWSIPVHVEDAPKVEELGKFDLADGEKLLQVFSVQTRSVLVVSCGRDSSTVRRVEFSRGGYSGPRSTSRRIRHLGRAATLCDYYSKERVLLIGNAGEGVSLYRLDERLETMEVMRSVNLAAQTTLTLPMESVVVFDGHLHIVDHAGAVQSLSIRNLQTSRKHSTLPQRRENVKRDRLLRVADGSSLGWVEVVCEGNVKYESSRLRFFATDDMRELPQSNPADLALAPGAAGSSQVFKDTLLVLDSTSETICVMKLNVSLKSDSFRIQSTGNSKHKSPTSQSGTAKVTTALDHWIGCLYHLYEKFPVRSEIDRSSMGQQGSPIQLQIVCDSPIHGDASMFEMGCVNILETIMTRLQQLNKPLHGMDLASAVSFGRGDQWIANCISLCDVTKLLRELITFVPVQICRAEHNTLTLMTDGQHQPQASTTGEDMSPALDAAAIAQTLRFGLLSPLLQSWRHQCIVITSMGKQSTGKSYFLNHLTGSSFAIAGARCTDGAWMSVRTLSSGVLLVVIDFEGLGSFERTEQEDVFLSVLNASVSMLTVFRMEMRLDKEIDELFSKFQKGCQLIKNDACLFRGKLYMSVKDVNPNDQCGVVDEFGAKFQRLLEVNKEKNFLTDMYAGQLEINCSPPLGTIGYYRSLSQAQRHIDRQLCSDEKAGFPSGKAFLDCIRLLLAKISILDWTSLDETAVKFKTAELSSKLPGVFRFGCYTTEVRDDASRSSFVRESLVDTAGGKIDVSFEEVCAVNNALASSWREVRERTEFDRLEDDLFDFGVCEATMDPRCVEAASQALRSIFTHFVKLMDVNSDGWVVVSKSMQLDFDAFLSYVVRRRCLRVRMWCRTILGERVPDAWATIEQHAFGSLQSRFVRCLDSCSKCQLGCLKASAHTTIADLDHDCGTNHACLDVCAYCSESEAVGKTPTCAKPAGHDGRCECAQGDHTCRQQCFLQNASNCARFCSKKAGHEDGVHRCAAGLHKCGLPCIARGCTRECVLDVEGPHQVHKCEVDRCLSACVMEGCNRGCSSRDHFHGFNHAKIALMVENSDVAGKMSETFDDTSDRPTIHLCDEVHTCPELCAQDGICHIEVFLKQSSKTFVGSRGTFQYMFQEMNGSRKRCGFQLPAGQTTHEGKHSCCGDESGNEDEETKSGCHVRHYCNVRCPCCSYYCQLEHGHNGLHKTTHGNMRNTMFISDQSEIDLMDRMYTAGERGTAEMCNLYCSKMGRSHVHYLDCEREANSACVYSGSTEDMRRHCTRALEPRPEKEQDEVLHERFWDTLGWDDPCASVQEREEFGKCAYKCDAPDHDGKDPSYCVLKAWHVPAAKPSVANDGYSYIGGHQFECSHISTSSKMHHVFVLDASGSMSGSPWQNLLAAFGEYVQNRVTMGAIADLVSVITFASSATIVWEAQDISRMISANVPYTSGGTSFGAGLRTANEVLSRVAFDTYKPVIVFLSDGHPTDGHQGELLASHIAQSYGKYGLEAFSVGFGSINLAMLKRVAEKLGGTYCNVLTGDELKTTFHSISASLGTRAGLALTKPVHEMICVICQKELASEVTIGLFPCQHELHQRCLRSLMDMTSRGETKSCPTCRQAIQYP